MLITLDDIIYEHPPPPKPSIPSKAIPPPSKFPPLTHPLPQKPRSRHQSPSYPSQLLHPSKSHPISSPIDQESGAEVPLYKNVFDSELAAWSDMAVETTAIVSTATKDVDQQQQHRSGSKSFENDFHKKLSGHGPGSRSDNGQHASRDNKASLGISAGLLEHERSCSAPQETTELTNGPESNRMHAVLNFESRSGKASPADTAHPDNMDLPHASAAMNPTEPPNSSLLTENVDENHGILKGKKTLDLDPSPLDVILSESRETSLVVRNDQNNECIPSSFGGEHSTIGCSPDPSLSSCGEKNEVSMRESNTVAVVIPATRPSKPRRKKAAKRPHRRPPKRQAPRTTPFDESDKSDNLDDDDHVERTTQSDDRYRPTKKPRQLSITNSDRTDVGAVVGFQLGNLSLPDLRTIAQGDLTCHIHSSHIVYSFSWIEERQCSDHLSTDLPSRRHNLHVMDSAQEWKSYTSSNDEADQISCNKQHDNQLSAREAGSRKPLKRKGKEWTPEQDALLKQLREEDKLSWYQVKEHFPNRTEGAIKVRYYTTAKDLDSRPCASTSRARSDRGSSFSSSPEPFLPNRTQHSLDIAVKPRRRSRPARARRAVERYSP